MQSISLCKNEEIKNLSRKKEKIISRLSHFFVLFRYLDRVIEKGRLKVSAFKISKIRKWRSWPSDLYFFLESHLSLVWSQWGKVQARANKDNQKLLFLYDDISWTRNRIEINKKEFQRVRFHASNNFPRINWKSLSSKL